jgi:hypothetical protein
MAGCYCNSELSCSCAAVSGLLLLSIAAELRMLRAATSEHHRLPHAFRIIAKDMKRTLQHRPGHLARFDPNRAASRIWLLVLKKKKKKKKS